MTDQIPKHITRLLLVEGKEDQEFFIQLGMHLNLIDSWPLRIIQYGGIDNLRERLRTLAAPDTMEHVGRIGIVRDADYNTDALQSVRDAIRYSNQRNDVQLDIPDEVMKPSDGSTSVTILILPSSEREGMIEDLIMDVFDNDPVSHCVNTYIECLRQVGLSISSSKVPKARLRTFITGKNIGTESEGGDSDRHYLSDVFHMSWWKPEFWNDPTFKEARDFLRQLLAP